MCGGTVSRLTPRPLSAGLSPRVRGNPSPRTTRSSSPRSIPACAGEPFPSPATGCGRGVYPRVCGGTRAVGDPFLCQKGLSPRVRGNLWLPDARLPSPGSIPACAGEPLQKGDTTAREPVYPRVCGGTFAVCRCTTTRKGLSPRVRGNRKLSSLQNHSQRSIPACAGEPNA